MTQEKKRSTEQQREMDMYPGTFTEIACTVLRVCREHVATAQAAMLQIGGDGHHFGSIISLHPDECEELFLSETLREECPMLGDMLRVDYVEKSTGEISSWMHQNRICTSISMPVCSHGKLLFYLVLFDRGKHVEMTPEKQQVLENAARVLGELAQNRRETALMMSSYEVLRVILGNLVTGIAVYSVTAGTVFFENEVAAQSAEMGRIIRTSMETYVRSREKNGSISDRENGHAAWKQPEAEAEREHYDNESGLWFATRFIAMTWMDGSEVIVCIVTDVTQRKKSQQRMEYQTNSDYLTGLFNRRKFESDMRGVLRRCSKGEKIALLYMDLDDFKHINEGLSRQHGDILLHQAATRLQGIPGLRGHCYRMGGDEFAAIVTPEYYDSLDRILPNLMKAFARQWNIMDEKYFCTLSLGAAIAPEDGVEPDDLLKKADAAMHFAKQKGKGNFLFYQSEITENAVHLLDLENNMRRAIHSNIQEFEVYYQPVVDVLSGACYSSEALVRWNSEQMGFIRPGDFIPMAENLGLIIQIGEHVMREACRQCRIWNERYNPDYKVNINLSVIQLMQANIIEKIHDVLQETGVNPANIVLEITESFAIQDMQIIQDKIDRLKRLGPEIALDDFGTGYSSLNYIRQLPLDIIKVDKTFTDDIVADRYNRELMRLILNLSRSLETKIVVEGVEKEDQLDLLKSLGVEYIQGYYFGKPMPAEKFEEKMKKKMCIRRNGR